MKSVSNNDIKWILIFAVLIVFCGLYVLKIKGYFDYSARYGIESMTCNEANDNSLFILDGDMNTTWGLDEEHANGELFLMRFKDNRLFSEFTIVNSVYEKYPTKNMNIYVSADEIDWIKCDADVQEIDGSHTNFVFSDTYEGKYIRLEYDDVAGCWPITEIIIK